MDDEDSLLLLPLDQAVHLPPEVPQLYLRTAKYTEQGGVTDQAFLLVEIVSPGIGMDYGQGVLGVGEVVSSYQLSKLGLQLVEGGGGGVVEGGHTDRDGEV